VAVIDLHILAKGLVKLTLARGQIDLAQLDLRWQALQQQALTVEVSFGANLEITSSPAWPTLA
jgi:hypothetical protein